MADALGNAKKVSAKVVTGVEGLEKALISKNVRLVNKYATSLQSLTDELSDYVVDLSSDESAQEFVTIAKGQLVTAREILFKSDEFLTEKEEAELTASKSKVKQSLVSELRSSVKTLTDSLDRDCKDIIDESQPTDVSIFIANITKRKNESLVKIKAKRNDIVEAYELSKTEVTALDSLIEGVSEKLETWLDLAQAQIPKSNNPAPDANPRRTDIKIDRLTLPVFDGTARNFARFQKDFNTTVGVAYPDDNARLLYLKSQCLRNEPKELIKSVPDFAAAIAKLKLKYGRPELVISEVLKELDNLKLDSNEAKAIIKLTSSLENMIEDVKAVGALDSFCNIVTLHTIETKLPERLLLEWVKKKSTAEDTAIKQIVNLLVTFLQSEAATAETMLSIQPKLAKSQSEHKPKGPKHPFNGGITDQTDQDKEESSPSKQCYRCGFTSHFTKNCRVPKTVKCNFCHGRGHLEKACLKKKKKPESKPQPSDNSNGNAGATEALSPQKFVKFAESEVSKVVNTIPSVNVGTNNVHVRLPFNVVNTNAGHCNTLWDSGSMLNLIDLDFAMQNNLQGKEVSLTYKLVNGEVCHTETLLFQINLLANNGQRRHLLAYGITPIMESIPHLDLNSLASKYRFINRNFSEFSAPKGKVHLLIGADAISDFPKVVWSEDDIVAMSSVFGVSRFLVAGSNSSFVQGGTNQVGHIAAVNIQNNYPELVCAKITSNVRNHNKDALKFDFFSVEDLGVKLPTLCKACKSCAVCKEQAVSLNEFDARNYAIIKENLEYDTVNHHWEAKYPFIADPVVLCDNYNEALGALRRRETRLARDSNLKNLYSLQIKDFVDRGVIRKLTKEEIDTWEGPVRYVDHHEVHKESATTPLRLVINSSFKSPGDTSLNDILLKGPNVLNDLYSVLIRFRLHEVAFVGDISKMYHNIRTGELEGNLRRLLWRDFDSSRHPDIYVFQRVTFGDRPAGCIAIIALQQTADLFSDVSPEAARVLKEDSYMDDIVSGCSSREEAMLLIEKIKDIALKGGFMFKDFVVSGCASNDKLALSDDQNLEKVLGISWSPMDDTLVYNVKFNPNKKCKGQRKVPTSSIEETALTKRILLRMVNSIYDPLGILAPLTVCLKIKMKVNFVLQDIFPKWDAVLPPELQLEFKNLFQMFSSLQNLRIPRSVFSSRKIDSDITLVCFTDASKNAMCAAVYIRAINVCNELQVRLLTAKTRVSPAKEESIPRLELTAMLMGARLLSKVERSIHFDTHKFLLTDSTCALGMTHNSKLPISNFVGARVHEIRAIVSSNELAWVSSDQNIADIGSRGGTLDCLHSESIWLNGPSWLKLPQESWPIKHTLENDKECVVCSNSVFAISCPESPLLDAGGYSDLNALLKVTALCIKFFRSRGNGKRTLDTDWTKIIIAPDEYQAAENYWIKVASIPVAMSLDKYASLKPNVVKTQHGDIVKVVTSGRLGDMLRVGYDASELIILDPNHAFSYLILKSFHEEKHGGDDYVIWRSRTKYWIPQARRLLKKIRKQCYACRLLLKRCQTQQMANLPEARVLPSLPFANVAIDLFGPFQHTDLVKKRTTSKCWGVVITCLSCRAVYLDLTPSYDTDGIIQVLRRFMSIRGTPTEILSDQGSQLVAASKEIQGMLELIEWDLIKGWTAKHRITWKFVPTRGQHVNGCAEAMVKSAKKILSLVLGPKRLNFAELQTVLFEVAQVLNARPLGVYSKPGSDPLDGGPITPNHLLLGRATNAVPNLNFDYNLSLTKRARFLKSIVEEFWHKFKVSVFSSLMPAYKWQGERRLTKIGDVVLLKEDDCKVGQYKLGKVVGIKANKDGLPRTLTVEYVLVNPENNRTIRKTTVRTVHDTVLIVPAEEQ